MEDSIITADKLAERVSSKKPLGMKSFLAPIKKPKLEDSSLLNRKQVLGDIKDNIINVKCTKETEKSQKGVKAANSEKFKTSKQKCKKQSSVEETHPKSLTDLEYDEIFKNVLTTGENGNIEDSIDVTKENTLIETKSEREKKKNRIEDKQLKSLTNSKYEEMFKNVLFYDDNNEDLKRKSEEELIIDSDKCKNVTKPVIKSKPEIDDIDNIGCNEKQKEKLSCVENSSDLNDTDSIISDDIDKWDELTDCKATQNETIDKSKCNAKLLTGAKKELAQQKNLQPKKPSFTNPEKEKKVSDYILQNKLQGQKEKSCKKKRKLEKDIKDPIKNKLNKQDVTKDLNTKTESDNPDKEETGTWVQCCNIDCNKWRYVGDIEDPQLVPENWECKMNSDLEHNSCEMPEVKYDESEHILTKYTLGSVVWAKMDGYPWWPALIDDDPDYDTYFEIPSEDSMAPTHFHVTFFGIHSSRAWIRPSCIVPYKSDKPKVKSSGYKKEILTAISLADKAINMNFQERLTKFGFVQNYDRNSRKSSSKDKILKKLNSYLPKDENFSNSNRDESCDSSEDCFRKENLKIKQSVVYSKKNIKASKLKQNDQRKSKKAVELDVMSKSTHKSLANQENNVSSSSLTGKENDLDSSVSASDLNVANECIDHNSDEKKKSTLFGVNKIESSSNSNHLQSTDENKVSRKSQVKKESLSKKENSNVNNDVEKEENEHIFSNKEDKASLQEPANKIAYEKASYSIRFDSKNKKIKPIKNREETSVYNSNENTSNKESEKDNSIVKQEKNKKIKSKVKNILACSNEIQETCINEKVLSPTNSRKRTNSLNDEKNKQSSVPDNGEVSSKKLSTSYLSKKKVFLVPTKNSQIHSTPVLDISCLESLPIAPDSTGSICEDDSHLVPDISNTVLEKDEDPDGTNFELPYLKFYNNNSLEKKDLLNNQLIIEDSKALSDSETSDFMLDIEYDQESKVHVKTLNELNEEHGRFGGRCFEHGSDSDPLELIED